VERDIEFIKAHGVNFEYGVDSNLNINKLKADGFKYICIGIGAEKGNHLSLDSNTDGNKNSVLESLEFLRQFKNDSSQLKPGKNVAVVGGGNTAMDSARAAVRLNGVESVSVLYRRTEKEMPADREEYEAALADAVKFHFLRNPKEFDSSGNLTCSVMKLGEPDASGRRRPVATEAIEIFNVDTVITAIGEYVDTETIEKFGLSLNDKGKVEVDSMTTETNEENVFLIGDAHTGPSTIVRCIADAGKAANTIIDREQGIQQSRVQDKAKTNLESVIKRKGKLNTSLSFQDRQAFAVNEAARCLECNYICNKCVDVCPNRANIAIPCNNNFNDPFEIVHIEAYCNECGNCETFCPYQGAPYKDKLTLFNLKEDFQNSKNSGFLIDNKMIKLRLDGITYNLELAADNRITNIDSKNTDVINALLIIETIIKNHNYLLGPVNK